jgi:hypothetical protein
MLLVRDDWNDIRTFGALYTDDGERFLETLELPWRDNERGVSCIPDGLYSCRYLFSPSRKRKVYWLENVPGREAVQIHIGNFTSDIRGCILVGLRRDGNAVLDSRKAFAKLLQVTHGQDFNLRIERGTL